MIPRTANTALLVVDMQNGFCDERGSVNGIGLPAARLAPAIEPCRRLVAAARGASVPVIFTRYVYRSDYADAGLMASELIPDLRAARALETGTWDADIIDTLTPAASDVVIDKNRPSAFLGTPLESILRGLSVEDLVVCGVTTNCCVETTVRDAGQRDYRCFVVADATAEYEDDRQAVALKAMGMLFGYITDTQAVIDVWEKGKESGNG